MKIKLIALILLVAAFADSIIPFWILIFIAVSAAVFAYFFSQRSFNTSFAVALIFVIGVLNAQRVYYIQPSDIAANLSDVTSIEAKVVSDPVEKDSLLNVLLEAKRMQTNDGWIDCSGKITANIYSDPANLKYGDIIRTDAVPYIPHNPTYHKYLFRNGINSCVSVYERNHVDVIYENRGNSLKSFSYKLKRTMKNSIYNLHPKREADVICGMVVGDYSFLPDSVIDSFTNTGTLHILAASGFNCAIIVMIISFLFAIFYLPRKFKWIVIIFALIIYAYIVGGKGSIMRAVLMVALYMSAMPLKRIPNIKNVFFASLAIFIVINPNIIFDVGFQLSYLAVYALLEVLPLMLAFWRKFAGGNENRRNVFGHVLGLAANTAVTTVSVTAVTLPLTAYYFSYISFTSVPANICTALLAPVIFCEGFFCPVLNFIPLKHIGFVGTAATWLLIKITELLSSFGCWVVTQPSIFIVAGYYVFMLILLDIIGMGAYETR